MGSFRSNIHLNNLIQAVVTGGLVPCGTYNPSTDYSVGDSVDYNGSSYVMFVDAPAGTLPTDDSKWQVLASKGDTGDVNKQPIITKGTDYTLTSSDGVVVFTTTATATLPSATGTGQTYRIVSQSGTITIIPNGVETIMGESSQVIYTGEDLIITDVASGKWQ